MITISKKSIIVAIAGVSVTLLLVCYAGGVFTLTQFIITISSIGSLWVAIRYNSLAVTMYTAFVLFYYALVPIIQYHFGVTFYVNRASIGAVEFDVVLFIVLNVCGLLLGSFFLRNPRHSFRYVKAPSGISAFGILICIFFMAFLITMLGASKILLPRVDQLHDFNGYQHLLYSIIRFIPAMLLIAAVERRLMHGKRVFSSFLVWFLLIIEVVVANPINTPRFISLTGVMIVFFYTLIRTRHFRIALYMVGFIPFVAFALLPVTSLLRHGLDVLTVSRVFASFGTLEFSQYAILYDGFRMSSFPSSNYVLSQILVFVPSWLWPTRATSLGIAIASASGYISDNVGVNSFFDFFVDAGFVGVFIGSAAYGYLLRRCDALLTGGSFKNAGFMVSLIFTCFTPIIFRGDLSTAMWGFYSCLIAYGVSRIAVRVRLGVTRRVGDVIEESVQ